MSYDAFISYRRAFPASAQLICRTLRDNNVSCFLDVSHYDEKHFDTAIKQAIHDAPYFILVLTLDALDNCFDQADWVRKEILSAIEFGKDIIPVMCDGFKWPGHWHDGTPQQIQNLSTLNSVIYYPEYFDVTINRILEKMNRGVNSSSLPVDAKGFFEYAFDKLGNEICDVGMAFHAGFDWRSNGEFVEIMRRLIVDCNAHVRIIVNRDEAVKNVTDFGMTNPFREYPGFEANYTAWKSFAARFPDQVEVRAAPVPLLHRIFMVCGSEGGYIGVKYYTYGNDIQDKDVRHAYRIGMTEYDLYAKEFEYIWKHSI